MNNRVHRMTTRSQSHMTNNQNQNQNFNITLSDILEVISENVTMNNIIHLTDLTDWQLEMINMGVIQRLKAKRVRQLMLERRKSDGTIKEYTNCVICYDEDVGNAMLKPCNHENMCVTCLGRLESPTCPLCRSDIEEIITY